MRALLLIAMMLMTCSASLAEELHGGLFVVRYHAEDEEVARESLKTLESAIREFAPRLPAGDQQITVTIAHTIQEFGVLAGGRGEHLSGFAHSWESAIVVKAPQLRPLGDDYRGTLRHELVHVLLYRNTNSGAIPVWLNEGVAMMLSNELNWQASLTVAEMFLRGRLIDYRDLNMAFQLPASPGQFSDAYAQALSMTEFLRDEFGEEKLWRLIFASKTMSFGDAMRQELQLSPLGFWSRYQHSLWGLTLVGSLVSGSLFTPVAVLFIFAYLKKRRQLRLAYARMEAQEQEEREALNRWQGPQFYTWEEILGDEEDWRGDQHPEEDEEEDEFR